MPVTAVLHSPTIRQPAKATGARHTYCQGEGAGPFGAALAGGRTAATGTSDRP